jgi:hypothetical protein
VEPFLDYLSGLSAYEALKKAGIFSKDFWLKPGCQKPFAEPLRAMEFPTKSERGVKGYAACSYSTGDR